MSSRREQMVEAGADALVGTFRQSVPSAKRHARVVLDAILPQISTVEELEALPDEVTVLDLSTGDGWQRIPGKSLWGGLGCDDPDSSEYLIEYGAPLTVVWRPES